MIKTVYILGAGSSISHTNGAYPSIRQIFRKSWELKITTSNSKNVLSKYRDLNEYLRSTFSYLISDRNEKLDFEKVYTFIDIETERNAIRYNILKQQLLEILTSVFMKLKDNLFLSNTHEYNDFVNNINTNDTIITFNWDVLLDDLLGREREISYYIDNKEQCSNTDLQSRLLHYKFFIDSLLNENINYEYISTIQKYGFYLKLHGSVDWHICSNKSCRSYNKVFPTLFPLRNRTCRECLRPTNTLIIPPTLQKLIYPLPLIGKQWNIAIEELKKSQRIVFWGYGYPPTDFNTELLIRHTRYSTLRKDVYIININKNDREKIIDLFHKQKNIDSIKEYDNFCQFYPEFRNWKEE